MNRQCHSQSPAIENPGRLLEVLAEYLLASRSLWHPGTDGATVEEVVAAEYRAASEAGHVPGAAELIRCHPELSDAIRAFFLFWFWYGRGVLSEVIPSSRDG